MRYVLALDQGTTSSRAIVFDEQGRPVSVAQREFRQIFPQPGWVEHGPKEIFSTQRETARQVVSESRIALKNLMAVGITNQRETTIVWDRQSGEPIANAIVWQDRRTAAHCADLKGLGAESLVRERTGLVIDPYFSGTKIAWLLDNVPGARLRAERGELAFGTIDTWVAWNFSQSRTHVTDPSNASRTLLFNIKTGDWDDELLQILRVPRPILPDVYPPAHAFGMVAPEVLGTPIPLAGIAGDQQAALFGQGCVRAGQSKNTYGTGCFLLLHTGPRRVASGAGLLTTIACGPRGEASYALEGSVFIAGAALQWLRDGLQILKRAGDSEAIARRVRDAGGVVMVPAFVGLGAPYWRPDARGALFGLTRGTTRGHVVRAALESLAFQTRDLVEAMARDAGRRVMSLRVDGGAAANNVLMQYQADLLGVPVERPRVLETTALGAGLLAGLGVGIWSSRRELDRGRRIERAFTPREGRAWREREYLRWQRAVSALLAMR